MLYINLLGPPEIYLDDQLLLRFRTRKAQALLIYLAVTERSWTRVALATLFWPETDDASARKNLRDILPPLRRQLAGYLLIDGEMIGLNMSGQYKCDVLNFHTVLEKQLQNIDTNTLAETLRLYRGEFLEGFATSRISADFEMWAMRERERLHQLALMGFTTLCQRQQENGAHEAALITNRQLLKFAPWDEASHRRQMLLLAQSGQHAAALAHFDACRQILAEELDVEPDAETVALHAQIRAGHAFGERPKPVAPPPPATPEPPPAPHNLPRQLTSLIGRASEIETVQQLLKEESTALLTLVGQGGVGKTRLVLAVAHQWRTHAAPFLPDGIWFVPLAGIAAGEQATEQIAGAIAQAMGLTLGGAAPLSQQLIRALQGQQLLLILDNFEHLVTEQAFLLEVVQTAHRVKIMLTSREQLHLHAERLYPVSGLPVPETAELSDQSRPVPLPGEDDNLQSHAQPTLALARYTSVQLFIARAQQRLPEFRLTAQNQHNIGRICRLLGGVPLGIELAAQLYVEQGAAVLEQLIAEIELLDPLEPQPQTGAVGLDHLQTPAIDLPVRQRSIRAVFLHSWRLLTPAEQTLLRHCAIFRGGFTRAAVLTVADGEGASLLALVMKSLVRRDSHDRYDLHELVRQYVIDQFQQVPAVVHAAAQKHAAYFTDLLAGQQERLLQEPAFHRTLRTEIYNIRAAWAWSLQQAAIASMESCAVCLFIYLRYAGQIQESLTLATEAITRVRALPRCASTEHSRQRFLALLLAYAAKVGTGLGFNAESEQWLAEAAQIGEELADPSLLAEVYAAKLVQSRVRLAYPTMVEQAHQALQWSRAAESFYLQPAILEALAMGLAYQGALADGFQIAAQLKQLIQERNYHAIAASAYFLESKLYEFQQDWEGSLRTAQQGQALSEASGHLIDVYNVEGNMIWANLQLGNFAAARQIAATFGERARKTGMQVELLFSLYTIGVAEISLQNRSVGETYLSDALKLAVTLDNNVRQIFIHHHLGKLKIEQARYEQALAHFQQALVCAQRGKLIHLENFARAGLALTHLQRGELPPALEQIESFLPVDGKLAFDDPIYLFAGLVSYQVLAVHHDPRAPALLEQLYNEVQRQAGKIKDNAQRRIFLEEIPEQREIVALWQAQSNQTV